MEILSRKKKGGGGDLQKLPGVNLWVQKNRWNVLPSSTLELLWPTKQMTKQIFTFMEDFCRLSGPTYAWGYVCVWGGGLKERRLEEERTMTQAWDLGKGGWWSERVNRDWIIVWKNPMIAVFASYPLPASLPSTNLCSHLTLFYFPSYYGVTIEMTAKYCVLKETYGRLVIVKTWGIVSVLHCPWQVISRSELRMCLLSNKASSTNGLIFIKSGFAAFNFMVWTATVFIVASTSHLQYGTCWHRLNRELCVPTSLPANTMCLISVFFVRRNEGIPRGRYSSGFFFSKGDNMYGLNLSHSLCSVSFGNWGGVWTNLEPVVGCLQSAGPLIFVLERRV